MILNWTKHDCKTLSVDCKHTQSCVRASYSIYSGLGTYWAITSLVGLINNESKSHYSDLNCAWNKTQPSGGVSTDYPPDQPVCSLFKGATGPDFLSALYASTLRQQRAERRRILFFFTVLERQMREKENRNNKRGMHLQELSRVWTQRNDTVGANYNK